MGTDYRNGKLCYVEIPANELITISGAGLLRTWTTQGTHPLPAATETKFIATSFHSEYASTLLLRVKGGETLSYEMIWRRSGDTWKLAREFTFHEALPVPPFVRRRSNDTEFCIESRRGPAERHPPHKLRQAHPRRADDRVSQLPQPPRPIADDMNSLVRSMVGKAQLWGSIRCIMFSMTSVHRASGRASLSLESIVEASVHIADHDGLDAVSIRSVAAALQARPMSLYSFIESKDHLVARMLDAVMGEIVLTDIPDHWREALFSIARRTIQAGTRHPWIVAASLRSDAPGPNTLLHTKQTLDVLSGIGVDGQQARSLATAIDIYVIGFATLWKDGSDAPADDRLFTDGLTWLLDGFEHQRAG